MAPGRIRTIKPGFFTSPATATVDFPVRLFYQALWCWADDFGVGETNLNGLLGFAFPDEDGFTAQILRGFCADCARAFGVTFYTVRGRHYYAISSWEKHQKLERRASRRQHPTPDDPDAVPDQRIYGCADFARDSRRKSGAESGEIGAGTGEQGNRGTDNEERETRARLIEYPDLTPIPDDWQPSLAAKAKAKTLGIKDLTAAAESFMTHAQATGRMAASWDSAFSSWLMHPRTREFDSQRHTPGLSNTDAKVVGWHDLGTPEDPDDQKAITG